MASIVVAIREKACDREVLKSELDVNYEKTEQALDESRLVDTTLAVAETDRREAPFDVVTRGDWR